MRIYNVSDAPFECTVEGNLVRIMPPTGKWKQIKDPYEVEMTRGKSIVRYKDKWVKETDEGTNVNAAEVHSRYVPVVLKAAELAGIRELIKTETESLNDLKSRQDTVDRKLAEKDEQLKEKEKELAFKIAQLKKVEEEHLSKSSRK